MGAGQKKPDLVWKKIGSGLYRYVPSGEYYGLIKSSGKQIRRKLDTDDLALARRKLKELRVDIERIDPELARRTLELQAERFLPTITGTPSTLYKPRRKRAGSYGESWRGCPHLMNAGYGIFPNLIQCDACCFPSRRQINNAGMIRGLIEREGHEACA